MILTLQIVLVIVILISVLGVTQEKENKKLQENMMFTCAIGMALFFASLVWL
ncbi:MFS transporter [Oceanobacillus picturae]|uniref:MFS transporter n=1 Tax=Oceanobacillus picturae TaxID=171693 RepID=A0A0U9H5U9_9BACI|nr:hypothetical protein [Oceanobacillus picturae]GAQ18019.1 MFS transporter [Oceanobacillus picturae]